jgi:cysteinyl-tRNA synthetase
MLTIAELKALAATLQPGARDTPQLIAARWAARSAGEYARADELRHELLAGGIELEDTREGVRWHKRG